MTPVQCNMNIEHDSSAMYNMNIEHDSSAM